jgi:hypothetical protein
MVLRAGFLQRQQKQKGRSMTKGWVTPILLAQSMIKGMAFLMRTCLDYWFGYGFTPTDTEAH